MQKFFVQFALKWLITHRQIHPGLFINDGLVVGESIKAGLAMICAHTTFADASEAHFTCGKMDNHIIDASTAI